VQDIPEELAAQFAKSSPTIEGPVMIIPLSQSHTRLLAIVPLLAHSQAASAHAG